MSGVSAGSKVSDAGVSASGGVTLATSTLSEAPTIPQSRATLMAVRILSPETKECKNLEHLKYPSVHNTYSTQKFTEIVFLRKNKCIYRFINKCYIF